LLGLVTFTAKQRTREIGIRKVLGATVSQIVALISRELTVLIIIAIAITLPVGYYVTMQWLRSFEYHATFTWTIPLLAAGGAVAVAMLTMTVQSLKSARANPVDSLKE
jgi:putative ABC transport system permease protein